MYYGARYYSPGYRIFVQPDTLLPDPYNPQALNRYSYALDNPVRYTDPSGHYVETALDIAFLAMDINDIRTGNADKWTYIGLATDVACAVVPGVTGGRVVVKAVEEGVTHADNVGDLFKLLDKTADGKKYLKDGTLIQNGHLAGTKHPKTGVLFGSDGFPVFDSAFDTKIDEGLYVATDYKQFKQATLQLNDAIQKDPSLANKFTENQLQDIANGVTPDGYTWHHNQEEGVLQLVDSNVHEKTGHTGGRSIWGGGSDNR